jgi:hypothetical protein
MDQISIITRPSPPGPAGDDGVLGSLLDQSPPENGGTSQTLVFFPRLLSRVNDVCGS